MIKTVTKVIKQSLHDTPTDKVGFTQENWIYLRKNGFFSDKVGSSQIKWVFSGKVGFSQIKWVYPR